ncbi:hypothetical protein EVAR_81668_1 [Eumeta japonica]|uniref:Uncharacterized protein n=1 Tax=Eumeta variegata TaxID=151549 RepID=A0A4C1V2W4_EUMVA|nr:hypothetical protein EVAR_81668_1 [Eumeta japonica]
MWMSGQRWAEAPSGGRGDATRSCPPLCPSHPNQPYSTPLLSASLKLVLRLVVESELKARRGAKTRTGPGSESKMRPEPKLRMGVGSKTNVRMVS